MEKFFIKIQLAYADYVTKHSAILTSFHHAQTRFFNNNDERTEKFKFAHSSLPLWFSLELTLLRAVLLFFAIIYMVCSSWSNARKESSGKERKIEMCARGSFSVNEWCCGQHVALLRAVHGECHLGNIFLRSQFYYDAGLFDNLIILPDDQALQSIGCVRVTFYLIAFYEI